eukprot:NODE_572_length_5896_cov_0.685872.p3 type:complete len:257 gc:universal NODE_572_length_5896_cov_0.685872:2993-3763(+)
MTHQFLPWHPKSFFRHLSSILVLGSVGGLSKLALKRHSVEVINYNLLEKYVLNRKRPVITISNHLSTLDDPLLFGILPLRFLFSPEKMRFVPGAQELTFDINSWFFNSGQLIPIERGKGIWQRGVDCCIDKIDSDNAWIHLYPEGKVNQNISKCIRFKWGISRIIMESKIKPLIVPFAHSGMQSLMPLDKNTRENLNTIPTAGGRIKIAFGEPIDISHILSQCKNSKDKKSRILLTSYIQDEFEKFRQLHGMNLEL